MKILSCENEFYLHENKKNHFHTNSLLSVALKKRFWATQQCPNLALPIPTEFYILGCFMQNLIKYDHENSFMRSDHYRWHSHVYSVLPISQTYYDAYSQLHRLNLWKIIIWMLYVFWKHCQSSLLQTMVISRGQKCIGLLELVTYRNRIYIRVESWITLFFCYACCN